MYTGATKGPVPGHCVVEICSSGSIWDYSKRVRVLKEIDFEVAGSEGSKNPGKSETLPG